jgi:hypothetical protein
VTSIFAGTRIAAPVADIAREGTRGFSMGGGDGVHYVGVPEGVIAITTPRIPLMPNGIVLPDHAWPASAKRGDDAILIPGLLRLGDRDIVLKPFRTYDLEITGPVRAGELLSHLDRGAEDVGTAEDPALDKGLSELARAIAGRNRHAITEIALSLIGRGGGLTPEGDDLVVGCLATAAALGMPRSLREAFVPHDAETRTTGLSATLLRHAVAGRVVAPLLDVLCGPEQVASDIKKLVHLGHSTGRAYLRSVRAVAESVETARLNEVASFIDERK